MATYNVDDGHGTQVCAGVSGHEIERVARQLANRLGESVYYYEDTGDDDDGDNAMTEVEPRQIRVNVYRDAGTWYGARWIDGEYDGCDELGIADDATEAEAIEAARNTMPTVEGRREINRVADTDSRSESEKWTYEGYWNAVFGTRTEQAVIEEFGLSDEPRAGHGSVDEWLGEAEAAAWSAGGQGGAMPTEWRGHHLRAHMDLLKAVRANNVLPDEVAAFLRDEVECSIDGRRCDLQLTFAAVSQDLDGSFPAADGELTYNRARAKRLFGQHREALNEAWRALFG